MFLVRKTLPNLEWRPRTLLLLNIEINGSCTYIEEKWIKASRVRISHLPIPVLGHQGWSSSGHRWDPPWTGHSSTTGHTTPTLPQNGPTEGAGGKPESQRRRQNEQTTQMVDLAWKQLGLFVCLFVVIYLFVCFFCCFPPMKHCWAKWKYSRTCC